MKTILLAGICAVFGLALAQDPQTPLVTGDLTHAPLLPESAVLYTLKYTVKNGKRVETFARMLRDHSSPKSRIIPQQGPDERDATLTITDTASELKKHYAYLRGLEEAANSR